MSNIHSGKTRFSCSGYMERRISESYRKDFNTWSTQYTKGTNQKVSNGYKEATQEEESLILPETMFVKTKIEDAMAVKNPYLKRSVLGKKILDYGIISIDYIHQKNLFPAV